MKIAVRTFRGELPRLTPRELPENAAQAAINTRLLTGDLESWRHFLLERTLTHASPVQTIYRLGTDWLSWTQLVDVARGPIPGDATRRVYITGLDVPRWSNVSLATSGAEPYPAATRPIGVPAPGAAPTVVAGTVTIPTLSVSDAGDELVSSWVISPISSGAVIRNVTQSAVRGAPAPSYRLEYRNFNSAPCFMYRDFGVGESRTVTVSVDVAMYASVPPRVDCGVRVKCTQGGSGCMVGIGSFNDIDSQFFIGQASEWGGLESALVLSPAVALDVTATTFYRIEVTHNYVSATSATVRARLIEGTTVLFDLTATGSFDSGDYCGFDGSSDEVQEAFYDNLVVTGSGSTVIDPDTAVAYVFTYVNDLGEESAPSPASATVLRPDGVSVDVTTPITDPGASYVVGAKRIYRAVTGASGSIFRFVEEIPLSTAVYTDTKTDAQLGEQLESEGWDLPPADLSGIVALPNGVMAGFRRNQLCLSAQNRPHAWPVANRLNTDTAIVSIGSIDTTVVIGTESFPYLAIGTSPESYAMSRLEFPQACVSKRTLAYLVRIGVVFASPDGLVAVSGAGQVEILTRQAFTREQWQALNPPSMWGISHDDTYWLFYERTTGEKGGYAIDMKADGAGIVSLSWHATCGHVDPMTDTLYLVLDAYTDAAGLTDFVLPGGVPVRIYAFDAHPTLRMSYRWRGKLNLTPHPSAMHFAKVEAAAYAAVRLRVFGTDASVVHDLPVAASRAFRINGQRVQDEYVLELAGTSRVRTAQIAQTVQEID